MRIAYVTESFPPDVNGVAHTAMRVAEQLAGRGHEPLVIAPEPAAGLSRPDRALGYPVVRMPSVAVPVYRGLRVGLPGGRVRAEVAAHRADLVHLAGPFVLGASGGAAARRLRLPAVAVYATDMAAYARAYRTGRAGQAICWQRLRQIHNAIDRTLAPSTAAAADLRAHGIERVWVWGRLPDPGQMLGLPGVLARPLARRASQLNLVMDAVAERFGTVHYDAAGDAETYDRRMWAVDRLHPSERGHRLVARRFHELLACAGHPVGPAPDPEPGNPPPTRLAEFGWMATKGTAWVLRRSTDLVPYLLAMAVREWATGGGPSASPTTRTPSGQAAFGCPPGQLMAG